jgi:hypothetical protein
MRSIGINSLAILRFDPETFPLGKSTVTKSGQSPKRYIIYRFLDVTTGLQLEISKELESLNGRHIIEKKGTYLARLPLRDTGKSFALDSNSIVQSSFVEISEEEMAVFQQYISKTSLRTEDNLDGLPALESI